MTETFGHRIYVRLFAFVNLAFDDAIHATYWAVSTFTFPLSDTRYLNCFVKEKKESNLIHGTSNKDFPMQIFQKQSFEEMRTCE